MSNSKTEAQEALERLYGPVDETKLSFYDSIKLRLV